VGGDYYGYLKKTLKTGQEAFHLAVVDAAGKGISSSLYALSLRALFRTYSTLTDDVGEILSLANRDFMQDAADTGMFLQVFLGCYEIETKKLFYCACGHVPGFVRRQDGKIDRLSSSNIAIGLKESEKYSAREMQLFSGDIVVVYTDAVIEALNEKNEPFTEERLKTLLQAKEWSAAQEVVDGITAAVNAYTHSLPQESEIIVVVLRVN
jgi:phosphoserine phosphatase RsbU/P